MRLIDLDELMDEIQNMSIAVTEKDWVIVHIATQTIIDAVPVVHGRWVAFWDEARGKRYGCSACAASVAVPDDYCPHCGARMDWEEENGK